MGASARSTEIDQYAGSTTIHGCPEVIQSKKATRIIWLLFMTGAFAFCASQLTDIFKEYIRNPQTVSTSLSNEVSPPSIIMDFDVGHTKLSERMETLSWLDANNTDHIMLLALLDRFLYHDPSTVAHSGYPCPSSLSSFLSKFESDMKIAGMLNESSSFITRMTNSDQNDTVGLDLLRRELNYSSGDIHEVYEDYMDDQWFDFDITGKLMATLYNAWSETWTPAIIHQELRGKGQRFIVNFANQTLVKESTIIIKTNICWQSEQEIGMYIGSSLESIENHFYFVAKCNSFNRYGLEFHPETYDESYCDPSIGIDPMSCFKRCWVDYAKEHGMCIPYLGREEPEKMGIPYCGFQSMKCPQSVDTGCRQKCGTCQKCHPCRYLRAQATTTDTDENDNYYYEEDLHDYEGAEVKMPTTIELDLGLYAEVEQVHYEPKYNPSFVISSVGGVVGFCFGMSVISILQFLLFCGRLCYYGRASKTARIKHVLEV